MFGLGKRFATLLSVTATLIIVGCGGGDSASVDPTTWPDRWCQVNVGDTPERAIQLMGEPTNDGRDRSSASMQWDWQEYQFNAFLGADDRIRQLDINTIAMAPDQVRLLKCEESRTPGPVIVDGVVGGPAQRDGQLDIAATKLEVSTKRQPSQEWASETNIVPSSGAKFVIASLRIENSGTQSVMPLCIGRSTLAIDASDRNFDQDARTDDLAGNEAVCDKLQPGLRRAYKVLYEVPVDATITHIAIWDSDDPADPFGNESVIRFARR